MAPLRRPGLFGPNFGPKRRSTVRDAEGLGVTRKPLKPAQNLTFRYMRG
jgi:hypothetical protein